MHLAERVCAEGGLRLTPLRRRVFELVWRSHAPVSAYNLLDQLVNDGHRAQAPTVYRALEFLLENGLVHRVESMNAYVGCNRPCGHGDVGFFICDSCGDVAELSDPAISDSINQRARHLGFRISKPLLEVRGLCGQCQA